MTGEGKIRLILGPMFSGKTTELIRNYKRKSLAGLKTLLVKYKRDTRYSLQHVTTHDGIKVEAFGCESLSDIPDPYEYDLICIDEIQFYPDCVEFCDKAADNGVDVIASGLSGTFKRKPFKNMPELEAIAYDVTYFRAVCYFCKNEDACYTKRITNEQDEVVIGGSDKYHACCRYCYKK